MIVIMGKCRKIQHPQVSNVFIVKLKSFLNAKFIQKSTFILIEFKNFFKFGLVNQQGPIADQLREKLKKFSWARTGLGLPILPDRVQEPVKFVSIRMKINPI